MALIQCPECGREISDRAPTCPGCGCPIAGEHPTRTGDAVVRTAGSVAGLWVGSRALVMLVLGAIMFIGFFVLMITLASK